GATLAAFGLGLVPFSAFQIQLRAWLAMRNSRTPTLINLFITALNVVIDVVLYEVLPSREKVVGLALGFSIAYFVGAAWMGRGLRHQLGTANEHRVMRTHVRLVVATIFGFVP